VQRLTLAAVNDFVFEANDDEQQFELFVSVDHPGAVDDAVSLRLLHLHFVPVDLISKGFDLEVFYVFGHLQQPFEVFESAVLPRKHTLRLKSAKLVDQRRVQCHLLHQNQWVG